MQAQINGVADQIGGFAKSLADGEFSGAIASFRDQVWDVMSGIISVLGGTIESLEGHVLSNSINEFASGLTDLADVISGIVAVLESLRLGKIDGDMEFGGRSGDQNISVDAQITIGKVTGNADMGMIRQSVADGVGDAMRRKGLL